MVALADNKIIEIGQRRTEKEQAKLWYDYRRALRKTLTAEEYVVLEVLEDYANSGGWCWPSYDTIQKDCGISRSTAYRAIKLLGELGVIQTRPRSGKSSEHCPIVRETLTKELIERISGYTRITETLVVPVSQKTPVSEKHPSRVTRRRVPVSEKHPNDNQLNDNHKRITEANASDAVASQEGIEKTSLLLSEKTISSNPNPTPEKSFYRQWRDRYEAAADFRGRSGVIGECWRMVTGLPPDYSFLNGLAKSEGSGWAVVEGLLKMSGQDVKDDPKGYLIGVLKNGRNQLGRTRGTQAKESGAGRWTAPGQLTQTSGGNEYANPALAAKYAHLIIRDD